MNKISREKFYNRQKGSLPHVCATPFDVRVSRLLACGFAGKGIPQSALATSCACVHKSPEKIKLARLSGSPGGMV